VPRSLRLTGEGRSARIISHIRTPLYGSAYALILSSASSSVLGIVYWTLAARLYDAEQVGVNAAAISAMSFISYLAQLNMAGVLSRFIPTAGTSTRRLIALAYLAASVASAVGALIFVVGFARLVGLGPLLTADPRSGAWFVVATVAWSLFTLEDGALIGLRQTVWVPIENSIFGVIKIVLLLAFVAGLAEFGIFVSWTIPAAVLLVPVNWLIFRRLVPRHMAAVRTGSADALLSGMLRYLSGDYIGSLFAAASIGLLPLVVVRAVGAAGGAYFYIAWTIAYSLYFISLNMATSLMVEGAARRATVAEDTRRMFRLLVGLQMLLVVVVIIDAPLILSIFNPVYASEAATLLRLLALAVLPHGVNAIYLAVARVRRQVGRIILVQATLATFSLGASVSLLGSLGIAGAGVAWLVTQSVVAALLFTTQLLPLWRRPLAAGAGDLTAIAPEPALAGQPRPLAPMLRASFAALDEAGIRWCLLRGGPEDLAQGARDVDLLVAEADWPRLDGLFAGLGLLRVPGYGRGHTGFFVGRDADAGSWVRLDVTVDLAYGRFSQFETKTAAGCLARVRHDDAIPVLGPDDAFWALVLHCVLEKGYVADRHGARLQALVDQARDVGPLGAFIASLLPADWDPPRIRAVVRAGDWADVVALQTGILLRLWRRDVVGTTRRVVARAVQRGLGFGRLLHRRWGVSVALLGPDGAGKTTLSAAIAADFGLPVRRIYMGMWSRSQRGLLDRIPGLTILARPLHAWRKALVAEYHRAQGRLVIFDRYTYDALIPPRGPLVLLKRPYFWILAHAAPAPQLVIVLDVPGEVLFARKGEFDPGRLEEDRLAFRALGDRLDCLRVVDAARSPDQVRAEVTDLIWQRYLAGPKGR
jgi:thymidylate kinase/O-antigen/teichoic acid export membrane protein